VNVTVGLPVNTKYLISPTPLSKRLGPPDDAVDSADKAA
jgi:hypothetical protein